jgi:hypothetical protein
VFQGQYLFNGDTVYSPWIPRGGDNLTYSADLIAQNTSELKVEVYTKNPEDIGDGDLITATEGSMTSSGLGPFSETISSTKTATEGIEELVRFKFTPTTSTPVTTCCSGCSTPSGSTA